MAATIDGIINEPNVDYLGKDGFFWWFGEVVDNRDPMQLGRVRVRVMGWYTGTDDKFKEKMPDEELPWAVVLQPTNQPGVGSAGVSASGQLQQGAMVMGFFLDGQEAQSPVVMGVVRAAKDGASRDGSLIQSIFGGEFTNTAEANTAPGGGSSPAANAPGPTTDSAAKGDTPSAKAAPNTVNPQSSPATHVKPTTPVPAANGAKSNFEQHLKSMFEELSYDIATLVEDGNGNFLSMIDGTVTNISALTGKIKNLVSGIMSEALAGVKELFLQQISAAIKAIKMAGFTGIPQIVTAAIQAIISLVQQFLCDADTSFLGQISSIIGNLDGFIQGIIGQAIDTVFNLLGQAMEGLLNNIICAINNAISGLQSILDTILAAVKVAKAVSDIISKGTALFQNLEKIDVQDITSITSIISLILGLLVTQCDRESEGAEDQYQFIPFIGATKCGTTNAAGAGGGAGDCNSGGGLSASANLVQQVIREADPFLTKVETALSGTSIGDYGTPGQRARIERRPSGATWTSTRINSKETENYNKEKDSQAKGNPPQPLPPIDNAQTVIGDEIYFPGATDIKTKKDFALQIGGMMVQTVNGDYKLKIVGNMDVEIDGSLKFHVKNAPKQAENTGAAPAGGPKTKAQKSLLIFDSDTEVAGRGKFQVQGMGTTLAASPGTDVKLITDTLSLNAPSLNINCTNDLKLAAGNAIYMDTPSLIRTINVGLLPRAKAGIFTICNGSYDMVLNPSTSAADAVPRFTVNNTAGPIAMTCAGTGMLLTVGAGAFVATCAAGAFTLSATSGPMSIFSGSTLNITSTGIMSLNAPQIKLN